MKGEKIQVKTPLDFIDVIHKIVDAIAKSEKWDKSKKSHIHGVVYNRFYDTEIIDDRNSDFVKEETPIT